jgi:mono/diheme cytochrome c family protein
LKELNAYVQRHNITFPMLKDVGNRLADVVGATRTPEVYLLDASGVVQYHGRIDDQYGIGYAREKPQRSDLSLAIDELISGSPVTVAQTDAVGCFIGKVKQLAARGDVTFTRHIAPLLNQHCVACHREGEIGPFNLTSYQDIAGWEDTILEVVDQQRMPPWNANPEFGHFSNDPRLTPKEIQLLRKWIEQGMPEGDPADLPPPPKFVDGWKIPQPDQILEMRAQPFAVPAEGTVKYQRFEVDPGWSEDKYIVAAEARPQNRAVVHHILVYVLGPNERRASLGRVLVGYAPGSVPVELTGGTAIHVPALSRLLFELHYTPNGSPQLDKSYVGVCFTEPDRVTKLVQGRQVIEHEFLIPPRESHHAVEAEYQFRQDELLLSMTPHMHLRGKAFRYVAEFPDGQSEVLLDVPKYDFNWQLRYILREPKLMPAGTKMVCSAVFDNSDGNLANPNPDQSVRWGDQSWEEMMIGFFDTVPKAETIP